MDQIRYMISISLLGSVSFYHLVLKMALQLQAASTHCLQAVIPVYHTDPGLHVPAAAPTESTEADCPMEVTPSDTAALPVSSAAPTLATA